MDPLTIGLLGLGLMGTFAGAVGQGVANDKNVRLQRETNLNNMNIAKLNNYTALQSMREQTQANFAMQAQNQAFNADYNSARSQVARARAAGLNPNLTVDGAGSVSTGANSATAVPSMSMPNLQAATVNSLFPHQSFSPDVVASALKSLEEAKGIGIENDYKADLLIQEIDRKQAEISLMNMSEKEKSAQISYLQKEKIDLQNRIKWSQEDRDRNIQQQQNDIRAANDVHNQMVEDLSYSKKVHPEQIRTQVAKTVEAYANAAAAREAANKYAKEASLATSQEELNKIEIAFKNDPEIKELRKSIMSNNESESYEAQRYAKQLADNFEESSQGTIATWLRKHVGLSTSDAVSAAGTAAVAYGITRRPGGKATAGTVGRSETTVMPNVVAASDRLSRQTRVARTNAKAAATEAKSRISSANERLATGRKNRANSKKRPIYSSYTYTYR